MWDDAKALNALALTARRHGDRRGRGRGRAAGSCACRCSRCAKSCWPTPPVRASAPHRRGGDPRRTSPGTFFTVDLERRVDAFGALPWVRKVEVRRQWPDRLEVVIEEHRPLARWNDDAAGEPRRRGVRRHACRAAAAVPRPGPLRRRDREPLCRVDHCARAAGVRRRRARRLGARRVAGARRRAARAALARARPRRPVGTADALRRRLRAGPSGRSRGRARASTTSTCATPTALRPACRACARRRRKRAPRTGA